MMLFNISGSKLRKQISGRNGYAHKLSSLTLLLTFTLFTFAPFYSLIPQTATVPSLNSGGFQSQDMDPYFNLALNSNTEADWENIITGGLSTLQSQWENTVDAQIDAYVTAVTNTDNYNTVAEYQDYVRKSLEVQKEKQNTDWSLAAELAIEQEREAFLARLGEEKRRAVEDKTKDDVKDSRGTVESTTDNVNLSLEDQATQTWDKAEQQLEQDELDWKDDFSDQVENGLYEFQVASAILENEYANTLQDLADADAQFQTNQSVIKTYEDNVRTQITANIGTIQSFVTTNAMFSDGQGGLNASGQQLQQLVNDVNTALSNGDPLSTLVQTLITELENQKSYLETQHTYWDSLTYFNNQTYQKVRASPQGGEVRPPNNVIHTTAFWNDTFMADPAFKAAINSHYHNTNEMQTYMEGQTGLTFTSFSYDVVGNSNYPPDYPLLYTVAKNETLKNDGWFFAVYVREVPFLGREWFYEEEFQLNITYSGYDQNALNQANQFQSYINALDPLLTDWRDNLLPAVQTWETQVTEYNDTYDQWKLDADVQRQQALDAYNQGSANLSQKKGLWLDEMQTEYRKGQRKWTVVKDDFKKKRITFDEELRKRKASGDLSDEFLAQSNQVIGNLFNDIPGYVRVQSGAENALKNALDGMPTLQNDFLTKHAQNLPDTGALDKVVTAFEKGAKGLMNISLVHAMSDQAEEMRKRAEDQFQTMIKGAGYEVTENANGTFTATRSINAGKATLKEGEDPLNADSYKSETVDQVLNFIPPTGLQLAGGEDIFGDWDYDKVANDFNNNLNQYGESVERAFGNAQGELAAAEEFSQAREQRFQDDISSQIEYWNDVQSLAKSLLTGGTASGWVQNQVRGRFASSFEEATGIPAGIWSGMFGGMKPHKAIASYVNSQIESAVYAEWDKAIGIEGFSSMFMQEKAKRAAKKAKKRDQTKAVVKGVMSICAIACHLIPGPGTALALGSQVGLAIWSAAEGYEEGGLVGAVASAASSVANSYTGAVGVNVGLSYSKDGGWGGSVGYGVGEGFGASIGVQEGQGITNASLGYKDDGLAGGLNWSQDGGVSAYGGVVSESGKTFGLGYSRDEGFGGFAGNGVGSVTYNQRDGLGLKVEAKSAGYGSASASYTERGGAKFDLKFDLKKTGVGAGHKSASAGISYSEKGGGLSAHISATTAYGDSIGVTLGEGGRVNSTFSAGQDPGKFKSVSIRSMDELMGTTGEMAREQRKRYLATKRRNLLMGQVTNSDAAQAISVMSDAQVSAYLKKMAKFEAKTGVEVTQGFGIDASSRDSGYFSQLVGGMTADLSTLTGNQASDNDGFVDANGKYHARVCFVAGTLVVTKGGYKEIQDIKIGDVVLSWDEKTGKQSYEKVTETFINPTKLVYKLTYEDGTVVETTWNHPFWIRGRGWVEAKDIGVGDASLTAGGEFVKVRAVGTEYRDTQVYNIEVDKNHTYYVSWLGVLVHNYDEKSGLVEEGDTLKSIKKRIKEKLKAKYSLEQIAKMNGLKKVKVWNKKQGKYVTDYKLYPGQRIVVDENYLTMSPEDREAFFNDKQYLKDHKYKSSTELMFLGGSASIMGLAVEFGEVLATEYRRRGNYQRIGRETFMKGSWKFRLAQGMFQRSKIVESFRNASVNAGFKLTMMGSSLDDIYKGKVFATPTTKRGPIGGALHTKGKGDINGVTVAVDLWRLSKSKNISATHTNDSLKWPRVKYNTEHTMHHCYWKYVCGYEPVGVRKKRLMHKRLMSQ